MDDDFPPEPPRFWIAVSIFVAALTLAVIMCVYTTVRAEAQEPQFPICVPGDALLRQTIEVKKQKPHWQGTITLPGAPPAEALITQSENGGWTLFVLGPEAICAIWVGVDGNPPVPKQDKGA